MTGKHFSEESRRKISEAKIGRPLSEETRRKMSDSKRGEKNPNFGKHHTEETREKMKKNWENGVYSETHFGVGINGKRTDLNNQYFRSTWEANVARILNYWGIKWEYEVKRIPYNNGTKSHMIDFYLPETDSYLDVFGQLDKRHLEEFYGVYESGLSTQIIGPDVYRDLEKEFKDKLPFWENGKRKPKIDQREEVKI